MPEQARRAELAARLRRLRQPLYRQSAFLPRGSRDNRRDRFRLLAGGGEAGRPGRAWNRGRPGRGGGPDQLPDGIRSAAGAAAFLRPFSGLCLGADQRRHPDHRGLIADRCADIRCRRVALGAGTSARSLQPRRPRSVCDLLHRGLGRAGARQRPDRTSTRAVGARPCGNHVGREARGPAAARGRRSDWAVYRHVRSDRPRQRLHLPAVAGDPADVSPRCGSNVGFSAGVRRVLVANLSGKPLRRRSTTASADRLGPARLPPDRVLLRRLELRGDPPARSDPDIAGLTHRNALAGPLGNRFARPALCSQPGGAGDSRDLGGGAADPLALWPRVRRPCDIRPPGACAGGYSLVLLLDQPLFPARP